MKLFIFDTETTGLINRKHHIEDTHLFPYIVQLSWILYDTDKNTFKYKDYIIKIPDHVTIHPKSEEVHGISKYQTAQLGVNIKQVLNNFTYDMYRSDIVIAHNLDFDKKMMTIEYKRNNMKDWLERHRGKKYCTMRNSINTCKIVRYSRYNGAPYFKLPKLIELHQHLFDEIPENLHNSLIDVVVCLRCFYKMNSNKDLNVVNSKFKELYNELCSN